VTQSNGATGPFLYLPIEVASRELRAKLLLTYFAIAAGFEVVIGWKRLMNKNLRYMPPGVVVFKTLTGKDGKAMREAMAAGHRIAAIDEEVPGLVTMKQKLRWVREDGGDQRLHLRGRRGHKTALLRSTAPMPTSIGRRQSAVGSAAAGAARQP
jgi:hypothetical protein